MNVELLCQLGQRLVASEGGQSHLRLESRCVVPARSFRHGLSCAAYILAAFRQKLHLSRCSDFQSQLCKAISTGCYNLSRVRSIALATLNGIAIVVVGDGD